MYNLGEDPKNPGYYPIRGKSIHWPGGRTTAPPNTPKCGFVKEKCHGLYKAVTEYSCSGQNQIIC